MRKLVAAPPAAEASANPASPVRKITLRPNRSPSRPPSSSRLPKARAYAVTIHCRSTVVKCSASCAFGSAMFTIVASSTTISWADPDRGQDPPAMRRRGRRGRARGLRDGRRGGFGRLWHGCRFLAGAAGISSSQARWQAGGRS
jgi:hypothetical protein